MTPSIGVAVITHSARDHLPKCLPLLLQSPLKPRILVVNSSSNDGTVEEARRLGVETLVIPRRSFNHGSTRELARRRLGLPIIVMMTPDAYPTEAGMLEKLVAPLMKGEASLSYARQIPHEGADLFEAFPRTFNYPDQSHVRSLADTERWGVYNFFFSNCCAAYRNAVLDEIGGFPSVLTAEDTLVAANLLRSGHKIAYVAEAVVRHSHRYTLLQEFKRYFDTGYTRQTHWQALDFGAKDSARGRQYLKALLRHVMRQNPSLLPYALCSTAVKWLGYRLGQVLTKAPPQIAKVLSAQDFYWDSHDFLNQNRKSQ